MKTGQRLDLNPYANIGVHKGCEEESSQRCSSVVSTYEWQQCCVRVSELCNAFTLKEKGTETF